MTEKVLVTGAGGLIGYESCRFFLNKGFEVTGIDNNMREYFFGQGGDVSGNLQHIQKDYTLFKNYSIDIRDRQTVISFFKKNSPFDLVIHTAAQPSHDWATKEPFTDFDVNSVGTLNLLESFRLYSPEGVFIFTSTNKVYGDNPNKANLIETPTRYDFSLQQTIRGVSSKGISEEMSLDNCKHSLFGASKLSADIFSQEYGKYFGLMVGIFRGGCLTGPQHSAVELHGFLAYIADCAVNNRSYRIFGYKGKQVRDQIHSFDVVNAFWHFFQNPRQGEVYNIGGTKQNAASLLEIISLLKGKFGLSLKHSYSEENRQGDHICYYTDMTKFKAHYPNWGLTKNLEQITEEIVKAKKNNENYK